MTAKNEPLKTELSNPELLPSHLWAISRRQDRGGNGRVEAHTPLPQRLGGTETVWLTWEDHQQHGLLQSEDFGVCCFFPGDVRRWLDTWPENAIEFEESYREWSSQNGRNGGKIGGPRAAETNRKQGTALFDPAIRRKGQLAAQQWTRENGNNFQNQPEELKQEWRRLACEAANTPEARAKARKTWQQKMKNGFESPNRQTKGRTSQRRTEPQRTTTKR